MLVWLESLKTLRRWSLQGQRVWELLESAAGSGSACPWHVTALSANHSPPCVRSCNLSATCRLSSLCVALSQSGQLTPIDLIVEEHFHRAAPGGMGGTKAAGNYSPVLVTQLEAKRNNYAGREKAGWRRLKASVVRHRPVTTEHVACFCVMCLLLCDVLRP